jgi:integrase
MRKPPKIGPIGKGWINEVATKDGIRYVARWNAYVWNGEERRKVQAGPYELGRKVKHGPGLRSITQAKEAWDEIRPDVFRRLYPPAPRAGGSTHPALKFSGETTVNDFIDDWERLRRDDWEENSRINWEYYRDSFLKVFFGKYTIAQMNDAELVQRFMRDIADRRFSIHVAKKAFSYVTSILDLARDRGVILGNAARLIPKKRRFPKGIQKNSSQPAIRTDQFISLEETIRSPRDKIILEILFFCAVRRSELFVLKWKDFESQAGDISVFKIRRSFCSRTHKIKEWAAASDEDQDRYEGKAKGVVAVPPQLAAKIKGWAEFGDTDANDPESFIFPTKNGSAIIPTNWAEDVLKPAGAKIGISNISYHWFRRGHATIQHYEKVVDKAIQGQLRHAKVQTTREIYMQHVGPEDYQSVVRAIMEATKGGTK